MAAQVVKREVDSPGPEVLGHVLQMLDGMARDGIDDPELLIAALVHDLGKLLLLTREDPANVVCMTAPIGSYANGVGLDAVTLQWNHDEFGYSRLGEHVSEPVAWLVRYHSILPECMPLMNGRDFAFKKKYLDVFAYYDHETKSAFRLPEARIETYRDLIEDAFPKPILF